MHTLIFIALLFVQTGAGSGTSGRGSLKILKESLKPPRLTFTAELKDPNNNGVLEGYEEIEIVATVKNEGKGTAKGVRVVLFGTSKIIEYLGKEKIVGDISAGAIKEVKFTATVPPNIPSEEGSSIVVKVIEERLEWNCPTEKKFTIAVKPATKTVEEEKKFVDVDIVPSKRWTNNNAYGVVIGISDYQNIQDVKYARKDAEKVKEYFINVLGIPANHIYPALDNKAMKSEFEEIFENKIKYIPKGSFLVVYYAGHITPKREDSLSYLVPWDAEYNAERKTYSLKRLYEALNACPAKDIVIFLDGCFSGESRSILAMNKRPLAISNINPEIMKPKFVVFAAAKEKQESNDYTPAKHGLFTYYLLRALKEGYDENGNGWSELGELYNYVSKNVSTTAGTELYTTQEPVILPDGALGEKANLKIGKAK